MTKKAQIVLVVPTPKNIEVPKWNVLSFDSRGAAAFWIGVNQPDKGYEIHEVMTPDEYAEYLEYWKDRRRA